MAVKQDAIRLRKLSQQHAYVSIQMHESAGREIQLPGTDHKYLGFFLQKGAMTAGVLASLTGLTTGAVTGLIDRFEKRGLVKRTLDQKDRRKVIIVPDTKKIRALFEPIYQGFQEDTDRLFDTFSEEELKTLERYFTAAIQIMTDKLNRYTKNKANHERKRSHQTWKGPNSEPFFANVFSRNESTVSNGGFDTGGL